VTAPITLAPPESLAMLLCGLKPPTIARHVEEVAQLAERMAGRSLTTCTTSSSSRSTSGGAAGSSVTSSSRTSTVGLDEKRATIAGVLRLVPPETEANPVLCQHRIG
jgi:hypothetical protein